MIKAIIDIGTNSTRLAVANCQGENVEMIKSDIAVTRIGEQLGEEKIIKPMPLARTAAAVSRFVDQAKTLKSENIMIIATSAVRDAINKEQVVRAIWETTGISLIVLSGTQEAALSYRGACGDFKHISKKIAVLDIGGGSTELVYPVEGQLHCASVNMGAVRLMENQSLLEQVDQILQGLKGEQTDEGLTLIAVGGTATSLAAMAQELDVYQWEKVHGYRVSRRSVDQWVNQLAKITVEEKKQLRGLMPERADIIYFGVYILQRVMAILDVHEMIVSDKDLLYGALMED